MRRTAYYIIIISCLLFSAGCIVTTHYKTPVVSPNIPGFYHKVERGQTLWRISKSYNVDLDEVVAINNIPDAAKIELGQLIFIPRRKKNEYHAYDFSKSEDFIWPLKGKVVTAFGEVYADMINKGINIHPYKTQNVIAASSGKIVFYSNNFEGFGKTIIIDHGNGFLTVYAKNSQVYAKVGEYVQRGTAISRIDVTREDPNAYLHFQIRKGHIPKNPYFYLSP